MGPGSEWYLFLAVVCVLRTSLLERFPLSPGFSQRLVHSFMLCVLHGREQGLLTQSLEWQRRVLLSRLGCDVDACMALLHSSGL